MRIVRSQAEHERVNRHAWPGTRQVCVMCGEATDRCEEDSIYTDDGVGPLCVVCHDAAALKAAREDKP